MTLDEFGKAVYSFSVEYNEHKNYYQSASNYFEGLAEAWGEPINEVVDAAARQEMIDTDTIWAIRWYPRGPTGFYTVFAATFDEAFRKAVELDMKEVHE